MVRKIFYDIADFSEYIINSYTDLENRINNWDFDGISVIAEYEYINRLINYLLSMTDFTLGEIELRDDEDEYLLIIDNCGEICVEKAIGYNGYKLFDSDLLLIHEDCNSKILSVNNHIYAEEFAFKWDNIEYDDEYPIEDECDGDCENCDLHNHEDDYSPIIQVSLKDLYKIFDDYKNSL